MSDVFVGEESSEPLPPSEVRVGDLVFLHPMPGEALPLMITKYDRGDFSHVGVVVDTGVIASSRTSRLSLERETDEDYGGMRLNAIADLVGRAPHIGRVAAHPADRIDAATRTLDLLEYGSAHHSSFSFVKLFVVAAALDAVRPDQNASARQAILASAARAAKLWEMAEERRLGQEPSFFCSEAICAAYPTPGFTYADFLDFPPPNPEGTKLPSLGELISFVRHFLHDLSQHPHTDAQRAAIVNLMGNLLRHDLAFVAEAAKTFRDFVKPHAEEIEAVAAPSPGDALPTSLVTPRMLQRARWLEWVRPLAVPEKPTANPST